MTAPRTSRNRRRKLARKNKSVSIKADNQLVKRTVHQEFSGPLPQPEDLQRYDAIVPGAADRIIAMAETQALHRQDIEKNSVASEIALRRNGQGCGLAIVLAGLAARRLSESRRRSEGKRI